MIPTRQIKTPGRQINIRLEELALQVFHLAPTRQPTHHGHNRAAAVFLISLEDLGPKFLLSLIAPDPLIDQAPLPDGLHHRDN